MLTAKIAKESEYTAVSEHQQITFLMLNRFCHKSNSCSLFTSWMEFQTKLNEKYMLFFIVFQVLTVFLIKIFKKQSPVLLFLVVLH